MRPPQYVNNEQVHKVEENTTDEHATHTLLTTMKEDLCAEQSARPISANIPNSISEKDTDTSDNTVHTQSKPVVDEHIHTSGTIPTLETDKDSARFVHVPTLTCKSSALGRARARIECFGGGRG